MTETLVNWNGRGEPFVPYPGAVRYAARIHNTVWIELDGATFPARKWTALTRNCPRWRVLDGIEARTTTAGKRFVKADGKWTEVIEVRAEVAA